MSERIPVIPAAGTGGCAPADYRGRQQRGARCVLLDEPDATGLGKRTGVLGIADERPCA